MTERQAIATPGGPAHCEDCGAQLTYTIGSPVWQHAERDLCSGCKGKAAKATLVQVKREMK